LAAATQLRTPLAMVCVARDREALTAIEALKATIQAAQLRA
jgi:hypothetical protein